MVSSMSSANNCSEMIPKKKHTVNIIYDMPENKQQQKLYYSRNDLFSISLMSLKAILNQIRLHSIMLTILSEEMRHDRK